MLEINTLTYGLRVHMLNEINKKKIGRPFLNKKIQVLLQPINPAFQQIFRAPTYECAR